MGVVSKIRSGKSDTSGKPSAPHIPSAKEAQAGAPRGTAKAGTGGK